METLEDNQAEQLTPDDVSPELNQQFEVAEPTPLAATQDVWRDSLIRLAKSSGKAPKRYGQLTQRATDAEQAYRNEWEATIDPVLPAATIAHRWNSERQ